MPPRRDAIRFTRLAQADLDSILQWTQQESGAAQAERYRGLLFDTFRRIVEAPSGPLTRARDDVRPGLRSAPVRSGGRRGRHITLFRVQAEGEVVVTRILHDAMEPARHLPPEGP